MPFLQETQEALTNVAEKLGVAPILELQTEFTDDAIGSLVQRHFNRSHYSGGEPSEGLAEQILIKRSFVYTLLTPVLEKQVRAAQRTVDGEVEKAVSAAIGRALLLDEKEAERLAQQNAAEQVHHGAVGGQALETELRRQVTLQHLRHTVDVEEWDFAPALEAAQPAGDDGPLFCLYYTAASIAMFDQRLLREETSITHHVKAVVDELLYGKTKK